MASPLERNWSNMGWAPLAKSPNWASQITRELGSCMEYPSSKPSTPNSLRALLDTVNCLGCWPILTWSKGMYLVPVFWSCSTACLWVKVPLSTSWPLSLTWFPS